MRASKLWIVMSGLAVVGACQQRDASSSRDAEMGDSPQVSRSYDGTTAPRPWTNVGEGEMEQRPLQGSTDRRMLGLGEGERERADAAGSADVAAASAETGLTDQQVIDRFRADIASDPDLRAAAVDARLTTSDDGLVLTGTVADEGFGDALEDYAEALADGRDVDNELEVR